MVTVRMDAEKSQVVAAFALGAAARPMATAAVAGRTGRSRGIGRTYGRAASRSVSAVTHRASARRHGAGRAQGGVGGLDEVEARAGLGQLGRAAGDGERRAVGALAVVAHGRGDAPRDRLG